MDRCQLMNVEVWRVRGGGRERMGGREGER